jgi:hypothetical protein
MLIVLRIYEIRFACVADFSHALLDSSKDQSGFDIPVNNFLAILRQLDGRSTHHAHQSQNMTCLLICICSYKPSVTASDHSIAHRRSSVERQPPPTGSYTLYSLLYIVHYTTI